MNALTRLIVVTALVTSGSLAMAQFPGESFFQRPSVQIPSRGEVTLDLAFFAGANVPGALLVELTFDPAQLEIVEVRPAVPHELQPGFHAAVANGVVRIAAVNSGSRTQPIGGVSLAAVRVRSRVTSGTLRVGSRVIAALNAEEAAYGRLGGYGAELVVVAGEATTTTKSAASGLHERAERLAPLGARVDLVMEDGSQVEMVVPGVRDRQSESE